MKRFEKSFKFKLVGFDFETLENNPHSVFGLSKDLKLNYFNEAWLNFSQQNNGEPDISSKFTIGTSIELAINGPIKDYYINNYKKVLKDLKVWKHEYECSSPNLYRLFSQDVYPLKNAEGIIIINSLKIEKPFSINKDKDLTYSKIEYLNENGTITQCTNCRRTKRIVELEIWDWVPSFVLEMPANVSHSICQTCFDYYWMFRRNNK